MLTVPESSPDTDAMIVERFRADRSREYDELTERYGAFLAELSKETRAGKFTFAELEENEQDLEKLTGWLAKIRARDFFPDERLPQAQKLAERCRQALESFPWESMRRRESSRRRVRRPQKMTAGPGAAPASRAEHTDIRAARSARLIHHDGRGDRTPRVLIWVTEETWRASVDAALRLAPAGSRCTLLHVTRRKRRRRVRAAARRCDPAIDPRAAWYPPALSISMPRSRSVSRESWAAGARRPRGTGRRAGFGSDCASRCAGLPGTYLPSDPWTIPESGRCSFRERRPGYKRRDAGRARDGGRGSGSSAASSTIPEEDDRDGAIDPGTLFAEITDEWICPICGARKTDFRRPEPRKEIPEDWGN